MSKNNNDFENDENCLDGLFGFILHDPDFIAGVQLSDGVAFKVVKGEEIPQELLEGSVIPVLLDPNDENNKTNKALKQFDEICKKRKLAYEALSSFEAVDGKKSTAYQKQLALIERTHDELMAVMEELRRDPEDTAVLASGYQVKTFFRSDSMEVLSGDLNLRLDKASPVAVREAIDTLHGRILISTIEEEIENTEDVKKRDMLIEMKNNMLYSNIELESWYLHRGLFVKGQLLGVNEDPDPVLIPFLGMDSKSYNEMKTIQLNLACCEASKELEKACAGDDPDKKYVAALKLGTFISLGDEDLVSSYLNKAEYKVPEEAKALRRIADFAVRKVHGKETE